MATTTYFEKAEFISWLEKLKRDNGKPWYKSPKQIAGYIGSIRDNILEKIVIKENDPKNDTLAILIDELPNYISDTKNAQKGIECLNKLSRLFKFIQASAAAGNPYTIDFF